MNGVDGVVLVLIQITDDPSVERTAPLCSTHVQPEDVSSFLISKRRGEVEGELRQHDGVVVEFVVFLQSFAKLYGGEGRVGGGR